MLFRKKEQCFRQTWNKSSRVYVLSLQRTSQEARCILLLDTLRQLWNTSPIWCCFHIVLFIPSSLYSGVFLRKLGHMYNSLLTQCLTRCLCNNKWTFTLCIRGNSSR